MKGKGKALIRKFMLALLTALPVLQGSMVSVFAADNGGLQIDPNDVIAVLKKMIPHFSIIGVVLAAGIIIIVFLKKYDKNKRKFLRKQVVVSMILVVTVVCNAICFGPMASLLNLVFADSGEASETTKKEAEELIEEITAEGIVMVKNEDNALPLSGDTKKLNVFGWASTNPCYGGTGSGSVDTTTCVTLLDGLKNGGYEINDTLVNMYTEYMASRPEVGMMQQDWTLPEPTADYYTDDIMQEAQAYSDTALIVISRVGGEGADLPRNFGEKNEDGSLKYMYTDNSDEYKDFEEGQHYLELSQTEKKMVELVCSQFDNVIVLYNGANAFELGWVNDYSQIKAALICPGAGQTGFAALGSVLNGNVNPSGKLADTYVYDLTDTPSYNNTGTFTYDNMDEFSFLEGGQTEQKVHFINYTDSIYVGYKFYETAYAEAAAGNMEFDYDSKVQYPFGYGLSYTDFTQTITNYSVDGDIINIEVTVENVGDTAGKDVVELYYTPPYTNGGIEKADVNLIDFAKTATLGKGETETVSFQINAEDLASYDESGDGCYVLEKGTYTLSIRSDSHTVLDTKEYTADETIRYDGDNARSTDNTTATNQFEFADGNCTYLSRANGFENYEEAIAGPTDFSMPEEDKSTFLNNSNYNPEDYNNPDDEMPTTGADNGLELADLRGASYDDEKWEDLLDELTVDEMKTLIALGGYKTEQIKSINKEQSIDNDGPSTIYNNFTEARGSAYPAEVLLATTWSKDLAKEMGRSIGKQANELNVNGWYAPAMNIHRSAFTGRNFEYFSEDGVLSGLMAAGEIQGADECGVYSYVKHFVLNDQEDQRCYQLCTWSNEQAIREIYLKPFEISVKQGGTKAVMNAHSFIGNQWTSSCKALNTTVLRDEWGFEGFVITDMFVGFGFQNADQAVRAGTDVMLSSFGADTSYVQDESATSVIAMRNAAHHVLYTVVNSSLYENAGDIQLAVWMFLVMGVDAVIAVLLIVWEVLNVRQYKKRKQENL